MTDIHPSDETAEANTAMKIAVVLRSDLEPWQRLNVAAFTISGVASQKGAVGEDYRDASNNLYLPMFKDPVLVFGAGAEEMVRTVERARGRDVSFSIFTRDLFETFNDIDNRAAVAAVPVGELDVVGLAFRIDRKSADKVLKGLKLLR
ncbi:DUF2000 domain-containing protein [Mesorhizobium sp. DCY119]|uniref:DUF2000 domain-containing protein n=1 Tax=Mesorhizobium sp. DCY119 TaxID=2108445 RepID=UPI000E749BD3|nr:DUF2000 domain-containing protein [Mesorhizobium sp. DCY119]RJG39890.1 DUF2000 domain-containing protein [Mesorhizobium sp. DCY119]